MCISFIPHGSQARIRYNYTSLLCMRLLGPKDAQLVSVRSLDLNLGLSGSKKAAEA